MEIWYIGIGCIVVAVFFLIKGLQPSSPQEQAKRLSEYYHPNKGALTSEWQQGKSEARQGLLVTLGGERAALAGVLESDKQFETAQFNLETNLTHLQQVENTHHYIVENEQTLLRKATDSGRSVQGYEELKRQEGVAQVEILKTRGLKDVEWGFLEKETKLELWSALQLAIKQHKEMEELTKIYAATVRQRHQIYRGDDPDEVKQKLLKRLDKNIRLLDEAINAKARHNQGMDGQDV